MSYQGASFEISSSFASKIILPPQNSGKSLPKDDKLISGNILTLITRKGFFFNHSSSVTSRPITLTRQGFMIIYSSEDSGYVLNLFDARKVKTSTKKGFNVKRTCVEINMNFGQVTLAIMGEKAEDWVKAILHLVSGLTTVDGEELGVAEKALSSCVAKSELAEVASKMKQKTVDCSKLSDSDLTDPRFSFLATASPTKFSATTTATVDPVSVRQGDRSVATLRQILMAKVSSRLASKKAAAVVPKEEQKSEKKICEQMVRRFRYKSHSAPVILCPPTNHY